MKRTPLLLVAFSLALVLGMVVFWPMRAGLGAAGASGLGLSARDVTGSIWSGRLEQAALGAQTLGNLDARLHFLPLLSDETRLSLSGDGAFRGVFMRRRTRLAVEGLDLRAPISALGLPGAGTAGISQGAVAFDGPTCQTASGRLSIEGLAGSGWVAPPLVGALSCDDGQLLARLNGQDPALELNADMRFDRTGRWTLDILARPADPLVAAALAAQGFQPTGEGLTYSTAGRIPR